MRFHTIQMTLQIPVELLAEQAERQAEQPAEQQAEQQAEQPAEQQAELQKLQEEIRLLRSQNIDLELEIKEVDRRHNLLRCHEYERVEGWTRHLSWEDRPGEFYWYCEETGERQWDGDEDGGEVNEPNWWKMASN
jgi:hypothetical protein